MIQSIQIQNLRGIREGSLSDLTPLVVLVGPNGSGKSTVLDALLIGASPNAGDAVGRAVRRRIGVQQGARWLIGQDKPGAAAEVTVTDENGTRRSTHLTRVPSGNDNSFVLEVKTHQVSENDTKSLQWRTTINTGNHYSVGTGHLPLNGLLETRIVEAARGELQPALHEIYSRSVEQGRRAEIAAIAGEVVEGVRDLLILTEGDRPIVHLDLGTHSVPVALAGDGTQSLIRLSLELSSPPGGLVLLEEPEVHQHPKALRQSARAIWTAVRHGTQIVLSTHSLELIDALLAEAKDDRELEGMSVYRLLLDDGLLKSSRDLGPDAAFARARIEEDLR